MTNNQIITHINNTLLNLTMFDRIFIEASKTGIFPTEFDDVLKFTLLVGHNAKPPTDNPVL